MRDARGAARYSVCVHLHVLRAVYTRSSSLQGAGLAAKSLIAELHRLLVALREPSKQEPECRPHHSLNLQRCNAEAPHQRCRKTGWNLIDRREKMEDNIHEDYKETGSQQRTVPCAVAVTEMTSNLDGQDHGRDGKRHQQEECRGTHPNGVRAANQRWIRRIFECGN